MRYVRSLGVSGGAVSASAGQGTTEWVACMADGEDDEGCTQRITTCVMGAAADSCGAKHNACLQGSDDAAACEEIRPSYPVAPW
ncbi:MAG: hypothetical protein ABW321_30055 [Polyangiales bacterium]